MKARNFKYGNDKSNNSQPEYNFECPFLLASKNGSAVCCSSSVLESWQVAKPKRVVPLLGQLDSNVQKRCGDVPNSCALRKVVIGWVIMIMIIFIFVVIDTFLANKIIRHIIY